MKKITETFGLKKACDTCDHYLIGDRCMAFIKGIPDVILTGVSAHKKPLSEQRNSIVYMPESK